MAPPRSPVLSTVDLVLLGAVVFDTDARNMSLKADSCMFSTNILLSAPPPFPRTMSRRVEKEFVETGHM